MKKTISIFTALFLCIAVGTAVYVAAAAVKAIEYEEKLDSAAEQDARYVRDSLSLAAENENLRKLLSLYDNETSVPEESGDAGESSETSQDTLLSARQEAVLSAMNILKEARRSVESMYVFKDDSPFAIDKDATEKLISDTCRELLTDTSVPVDKIKDTLLFTYFDSIPDPFTCYHTRDDMRELEEQSEGKLYGIGIYIYFDSENSALYIERVMPGSPAEAAGLMRGDLITSIEGVEISPETYDDCIASVAGEMGTEVTLGLIRDGKQMVIKPLRGEVRTTSVYTDYDGDYAVINIKEFSGFVADDFAAAIKAAEAKNVKGYIFDVRDNPGGDLQIICDVLDILLPQGPIVTIVAYNGQTYSYDSDASSIDKPMVVLCNENTASAGELFTSALKDYNKATVIGTKTYGKGTMQQIYYLSDRSGFRVSMAYYNPPFSENYHLVGVEPNITVEQSEKVAEKPFLRCTADDTQYRAAIEELDSKNK